MSLYFLLALWFCIIGVQASQPRATSSIHAFHIHTTHASCSTANMYARTRQGWLQLRPLLLASVRAVSAGCILSLALVHVSMHAVSEMEGLVGGDGGGHDGHDHRRRHLRSRSLLASQLLVEFEDYGGGGHEEHEGGGGGRHHHPFPIGMCVVVFG